MLGRDALLQCRDLLPRLLERHVGLQPGHHVQVVPVPLRQVLRRPRGRHPEVNVARRHEVEIPRHHADDLVRPVVEQDLPAEHVGGSAEAPLPQPMAEDRDLAALPVFVFIEDAAQQRLGAEDGPQIAGGPAALQLLGLAVARERHAAGVGGRDVREHRVATPPVLPLQRRREEAVRRAVRAELVPQDHETVSVRVRQRADQHGVDRAEHRGVDPDAEGQGRDRDCREPGVAAELAQAVADVASEMVGERQGCGHRHTSGLSTVSMRRQSRVIGCDRF